MRGCGVEGRATQRGTQRTSTKSDVLAEGEVHVQAAGAHGDTHAYGHGPKREISGGGETARWGTPRQRISRGTAGRK